MWRKAATSTWVNFLRQNGLVPKISVADHIAEHLSHRNLPIKVNFYGVAAYGKPLWCHGNED